MPIRDTWTTIDYLPYVYLLADEVTALSDADADYWRRFNSRVHIVASPSRVSVLGAKTLKTKHNVLSLGRISREKRVEETIKIIAKTRARIPDASLTIIGPASDKEYLGELQLLVSELDVEQAVDFKGRIENVGPYFRDAQVFLMTSIYEGFPLTLLECMSVGTPVIMYDLPYLAMQRNGEGVIVTAQGDSSAAAKALARLLSDEDYYARMSEAAITTAKHFVDFNFRATWEAIFNEAETPSSPIDPSSPAITMWTTLQEAYDNALSSRDSFISGLYDELGETRGQYESRIAGYEESIAMRDEQLKKRDEEINRYKEDINAVRSSTSFKIGRIITFLPGLIKRKLRG